MATGAPKTASANIASEAETTEKKLFAAEVLTLRP